MIESAPRLSTRFRFQARLSDVSQPTTPVRLTVLMLSSNPRLRTLPMFCSWLPNPELEGTRASSSRSCVFLL